jgi:hypothetical protein
MNLLFRIFFGKTKEMLSRCCQWPISQNFFGIINTTIGALPQDFTWAYTARGINHAVRSFMKLTPGANVIKLFFFGADDEAK